MSEMISSSTMQGISSNDYTRFLPLIKALHGDDWKSAKRFLDLHQDAVRIRITPSGETALHIVSRAGKVKLVELLVRLMLPDALELKNNEGLTALLVAAVGGMREIAEILVTKNDKLVCMKNKDGLLPVEIAAINVNKDMVRYLYLVTPITELNPETTNNNGATLLNYVIISDIYDIALDLLQRYPKLATTSDAYGMTTMNVIATRPSAFPSGCQHGIWQRFVYQCIPEQLTEPIGYIVNDQGYPRLTNDPNDIFNEDRLHRSNYSVIHRLHQFVWNALKLSVPSIKKIHDRKLVQTRLLEVLKILCIQISTTNVPQLLEAKIYEAIFEATKFGIVEFIVEILKSNPSLIWRLDGDHQGIFQFAIIHRQEKIFNLIYEMGEMKEIANQYDKYGNNMLHSAALLAPSSQLDKVSGAALQMQRELQWFKEVETIVQPRFKVQQNSEGKRPQALFTEQHKELVKEGAKWMKETAQSCMIVATLIAIVMFITAAFTLHSGNNGGIGLPIFLQSRYFMVFIVSDALSLFSSCTSVLMFLSILTSRYAEEDFLKSLPKKLIIALATLFFSIMAMMSAFGAILFIVLHEKVTWVAILVSSMATVPVTFFALLQFPLFVEIVFSTYGSGIFRKKTKHMYL